MCRNQKNDPSAYARVAARSDESASDACLGLTSAGGLADRVGRERRVGMRGPRRGCVPARSRTSAGRLPDVAARTVGAPVMPLSHDRTVDALLIVRGGGEFGITLPAFAARWPSQSLPSGTARRKLTGVGQVVGSLVRRGLVQRSSSGRYARFSLTQAGEQFLAEASPRRRSS
jgi:hypothetical protein